MRRRPDDPGAPGNIGEAEHEDDLNSARSIIGWALAAAPAIFMAVLLVTYL